MNKNALDLFDELLDKLARWKKVSNKDYRTLEIIYYKLLGKKQRLPLCEPLERITLERIKNDWRSILPQQEQEWGYTRIGNVRSICSPSLQENDCEREKEIWWKGKGKSVHTECGWQFGKGARGKIKLDF